MITEQEARESSNKKFEELKALAKKLQIKIIAKQVVTPESTIEIGVFYIDYEKYDIKVNPKVTRDPLKVPERESHFAERIPATEVKKDDENTIPHK